MMSKVASDDGISSLQERRFARWVTSIWVALVKRAMSERRPLYRRPEQLVGFAERLRPRDPDVCQLVIVELPQRAALPSNLQQAAAADPHRAWPSRPDADETHWDGVWRRTGFVSARHFSSP
jgi:hypothetical protein